MVARKTWEEFRECKMIWFINTILHAFGWAIVLEPKEDGGLDAYPARVKFRGFSEQINTEGYIGIKHPGRIFENLSGLSLCFLRMKFSR